MVGRLIQVARSAYQYPLILKQLWHAPLLQSPDQEIVYRDRTRLSYRQLGQCIGRLASDEHADRRQVHYRAECRRLTLTRRRGA